MLKGSIFSVPLSLTEGSECCCHSDRVRVVHETLPKVTEKKTPSFPVGGFFFEEKQVIVSNREVQVNGSRL